jgi:ATP-binding cassette, subfamily C, bacterial LapB
MRRAPIGAFSYQTQLAVFSPTYWLVLGPTLTCQCRQLLYFRHFFDAKFIKNNISAIKVHLTNPTGCFMRLNTSIWPTIGHNWQSGIPPAFMANTQRIPSPVTLSIIIASLISNMLALALPFAVLIVYDRVIPNASDHTLLLLCGGVVLAVAIDVLVRIARGYIVVFRASRYGHRAFMAGVTKIVSADPKAFQTVSTAERLDQISAIDTIRDSRAGYLSQLFIDFPFFIIFVGAVFLIGGELGYVLLACVAIIAGFSVWNGIVVRQRLEIRQDAASSQVNFLIEILGGLSTIKSYTMEKLMVRRYERVMERGARVTQDIVDSSGAAIALAALLSQATLAVVVAFGVVEVIHGEMTIGGIAACMMLAGRAIQPLNRAAMFWSQYQSVRLAKARLGDLASVANAAPNRVEWIDDFRGAVDLKGVSFSYAKATPIFENLDLSIGSGETVALSGENWAGKSTLLGLLSGILKPDSGSVFYDGADGNTLDDTQLRGAIALIPQKAALFDGTILENLCLFDNSPDHLDRVEQIAAELGLDAAISKLAHGYQTTISSLSVIKTFGPTERIS